MSNAQRTNGDNGSDQKASGLRLKTVNLIMIGLACVLAVLLLISAYKTTRSYRSMQDATEEYIDCEQHVQNMQAGSDYLTDKVRTYVVTGDIQAIDDFFTEVNVTRRRDMAVEYLNSFADGVTSAHIAEALKRSNELTLTEYQAMLLAAEARGQSLDDYPLVAQSAQLTPEELAMTVEQKLDRAIDLVYNDDYQDMKALISTQVSEAMQTLLEQMRQRQLDSSDNLLTMLHYQYLLIALLMISVIIMVVLTLLLVIVPLNRNIEHIRVQQELPVMGSYELQYLAHTYNHMYRQKQREQDKLSYEATHDPLTGLYNRGVFTRELTSDSAIYGTLVLIDVDDFKGINDTYGHGTGDDILKKVARALKHEFRSDDWVCRMGGDEFAVIMANADSSLKNVVQSKIESLRASLVDVSDGLPRTTLSIGIAFCDRANPGGDLYQDADAALYRVKERGRDGYEFY